MIRSSTVLELSNVNSSIFQKYNPKQIAKSLKIDFLIWVCPIENSKRDNWTLTDDSQLFVYS